MTARIDPDTLVAYLRTGELRGDEITHESLEQTLGPQWEPIVALIRRTTVLTVAEFDALAAALATAQKSPAHETAWDLFWSADGVGSQTEYVSNATLALSEISILAAPAAYDAVSALAGRHLIGQHGFTRDHYVALSGPWSQVISPAHPDD